MANKDNNIFAMILAGAGALIAAIVGINELSKSKSNIKGNTSYGYNSMRPTNSAGTGYPYPPSPKKEGCGCSGGA